MRFSPNVYMYKVMCLYYYNRLLQDILEMMESLKMYVMVLVSKNSNFFQEIKLHFRSCYTLTR